MSNQLTVETKPLALIKPYWRNPRNNANAVEAVMQSIKDYGFNSPLIIDTEGVIIAGHTRYKALQQLGWTDAPCVVLDIPATKAKEYRIADNKTSELSTWDWSALIPELREIGTEPMNIYFDDVDLDSLLKDTASVTLPKDEYINRQQEQADTQFERHTEARNNSLVEMVCPHCGETYSVDRDEVARNIGIAG